MANRKPLVFGTDGFPEELPASDTLDAAVTEKDLFTGTNANAGSIVIGAPVYQKTTAGQVDLARANASGTFFVIGLVADTSIASSATGKIQTDGVLTATTAQWDAVVVSGSGGLVAGTKYYLDSATAGKLLAGTVPGSGNYLFFVGTALSTTDLEITLQYLGKKA